MYNFCVHVVYYIKRLISFQEDATDVPKIKAIEVFFSGVDYLLQQKLAKRDGAPIDRNRDIERLWDFYLAYKKRHKVDDIQQYEQRLRESGAFSANIEQYVQ